MEPTSDQTFEKIINEFKRIKKEEQMYMAIQIIVAMANEAGSSFCESVGIINCAESELRELLNKAPAEKRMVSFDELMN